MCGLTGLLLTDTPRGAKTLTRLEDIFLRALVASEKRGRDASGIAWATHDGNTGVCKAKLPPRSLVNSQGFRESLKEMGKRPVAMLGHSRMATHGEPTNPRNNHPIVAGEVVGTHNGVITNADSLFRLKGLPRRAEVDSEILFRLANQHVSPVGLDLDAYIRDLDEVNGSLTFVLMAKPVVNTVHIFKGNNPLEMAVNLKLGALLYSSEAEMITYALQKQHGWEWATLNANTCYSITAGERFTLAETPFRFGHGTYTYAGGNYKAYKSDRWEDYQGRRAWDKSPDQTALPLITKGGYEPTQAEIDAWYEEHLKNGQLVD